MAEIVERIRIVADSNDAQREVERFGDALDKSFAKGEKGAEEFEKSTATLVGSVSRLSSGFKSLTGISIGAGASIAGVAVAVKGLSSLYMRGSKLALDLEDANVKLATALRVQGVADPDTEQRLRKLVVAFSQLSNTSDTVLNDLIAMATAFGVGADKMDEMVAAALSLSKITNLDAREAMNQLIKSLGGVRDETLQTIPEVRALTKEQLMAGGAIDALNEKYKAFAFATSEGAGGAVRGLKDAFDDWNKTLGTSIVNSELFGNGIGNLDNILRVATSRGGGFGQLLASFGEFFFDAEQFEESVKSVRDAAMDLAGSFDSFLNPAVAKMRTEAARLREEWQRFEKTEVSIDLEGIGEDFLMGLPISEQFPEMFGKFSDKLERDKTALFKSHLDQRIAITNKYHEDIERAELESEERRASVISHFAGLSSNITGQMFGAILDAGEAAAKGADVNAKELSKALLRGVGRTLIGRGIADGVEGAARLIRSYGADQSGSMLIKIGAAETAIGAAFLAGGLAGGVDKDAPSGISFNDKKRRGGKGDSASGFTGGGSRGGGGSGGGGGITVVFNGPTVAAEVGYAIEQARMEAREAGLI